MSAPVLTTQGLIAGYERDLPIVRGVDFEARPGELVAILGPNGAGKSTFVKAIAGTSSVFGGSVRLEGKEISGLPLHQRIREGLGFVPQTENIFATLTIAENLRLAADALPKGQRAERIAKMNALFPDLAARPNVRAGGLSGGQRQMLAVARTLLMEPRILILDEPSAGLSPKAAAGVFALLKEISRRGVAVVLVEQNVKSALALADRAVILVEGRLRHEGRARDLIGDSRLAELYLGPQEDKP